MPFSVTLRIDPYWQTIVDEITLLIYVSFVSIFIGNSTTKHSQQQKQQQKKRHTAIDSGSPDEITVAAERSARCRLWKMCV